MKQAVQKFANRLGYRISKIDSEGTRSDPFVEMGRLCKKINRPTIFDVGAHHGQTAMLFKDRFPGSLIHSFEPFSESFGVLKGNTAKDPNIRIFNYGLSDRNAMLNFHSNPSSATNSLLSTAGQGSATWGKGLLETKEIIEAEFRTLDSVIAELRIPRVNILKLDVQGAEHLVLKGAESACQQGRIDLIFSEIITQPTYENQKRMDQALGFFYEAGFELYNIFNPHLTKLGRLAQVDVIFTRTV